MFQHSGNTDTKNQGGKPCRRSYTENDCPCFQVLKADCRCTEKSHEDVSGVPESRTTGNIWKNVSEKAGRSGYVSFEY